MIYTGSEEKLFIKYSEIAKSKKVNNWEWENVFVAIICVGSVKFFLACN